MKKEKSDMASCVMMISPAAFAFNALTATTNSYQPGTDIFKDVNIHDKAVKEFNGFAQLLNNSGIETLIFNDTKTPRKPDAIFPNNWLSTHSDGAIVLYPMCAENRRPERRKDIIQHLSSVFQVKNVIDLSLFEKRGQYLEGTGSVVFDHCYRRAFACISPRTFLRPFFKLCKTLDYEPFAFHAFDESGAPVYHTNVILSISDHFVVLCTASIPDQSERNPLIALLTETRELIDISYQQVRQFCGNILQVNNKNGDAQVIMSQRSKKAFSPNQLKVIEKYCEIISQNLNIIETVSGGSARCILAEIYLPLQKKQ